MAHRLSRSSTSIVKKRCVGNDLYGASTCFPVKNGGEVAKSPPLQPRALSWASCTRVLYVFSLGQIYIRVCVHVWVVPTFFISSSIATSYTIHLPCQNTGSFVGADPFFFATRTRHHALEYAGQMMSVDFLHKVLLIVHWISELCTTVMMNVHLHVELEKIVF